MVNFAASRCRLVSRSKQISRIHWHLRCSTSHTHTHSRHRLLPFRTAPCTALYCRGLWGRNYCSRLTHLQKTVYHYRMVSMRSGARIWEGVYRSGTWRPQGRPRQRFLDLEGIANMDRNKQNRVYRAGTQNEPSVPEDEPVDIHTVSQSVNSV